MFRALFVSLFLLLLTGLAFAATAGHSPAAPCDIQVVADTDSLIDALPEGQVLKFLSTFQKDCNSNVEFSEYGNEVLFKLIQKHPDQVMEVLETTPKLDLPYILKHLRNPLLDFDLAALTQRIMLIPGNGKVKGQVLDALEKAQGENAPVFR